MSSEIHVLGEKHSLFNQFLSEIRDVSVQQDRMRFRRNVERIGEIFAYEISQVLPWSGIDVTTPLGVSPSLRLSQQPVLATILRAGLPLHRGLLNYFDQAENAFISAYRKHEDDDDSFEVEIEYLSSPPLDGKTVILSDPMLASGTSMTLAWKALLDCGQPEQLHVAVIIASEEGMEFARANLPAGTTFWIGAVDPSLTPRMYIVPGLGDAGDLAYGAKE